MHRVLCFGDSNTWGHDPKDGSRLPDDVRWTGVLQQLLGSEYKIIEEGLCGRTTMRLDPVGVGRNGLAYFAPCLQSQMPLDMVLIMLGTNDFQCVHSQIPATVAEGAEQLVLAAQSAFRAAGRQGKIMLISPIFIGDTSIHPYFRELFPVGRADVMSRRLAPFYQEIATRLGCLFFDASTVAQASAVDGLHMDEQNHHQLAEALAKEIRSQFE